MCGYGFGRTSKQGYCGYDNIATCTSKHARLALLETVRTLEDLELDAPSGSPVCIARANQGR